MAITLNVIATNSANAHPLPINPGATLHDVLIAGVVTDSSGDGNPYAATSFDQLVLQHTTADSQDLAVLRKKDASGSEGSLDITNNIAAEMIGFIMSLTGADNTTPEDVASTVANNNTADASPWTIDTSITPVTDGCMIVAVMGSDTTSASTPVVHTFATTVGTTGAWTVRADLGTGFRKISVATAIQTIAGAITVRGTGTLAAVSAGRSMALLAIRPAAVAGGLKGNLALLGVGQ